MVSLMDNSNASSDISSWSSILTLVVFFVTNIIIIFPSSVPVPFLVLRLVRNTLVSARIISPPRDSSPPRRRHIHFDFITVPLISVLALLACGAIDGTTIRKGMVGADGVHPIDIMALFISLAYLSISLDATGLFRFLAFWVARKGGKSGQRLYFYLYCFFLVSGVIVGNDPIILSGTAFLAYLTRMSGITPPTAWIYAQFTAANMASAVLVSSNPTNLVLSGAFNITFITYTSTLILPFIASAIIVYPVLSCLLFRKEGLIPKRIDLSFDDDAGQEAQNSDDSQPRANGGNGDSASFTTTTEIELERAPSTNATLTLHDKPGAIFGSLLLLVTLAVLVGTSTIRVQVWQVTVPPALIMLGRDAWCDWRRWREAEKGRTDEHGEDSGGTGEASDVEAVIGDSTSERPIEMQRIKSNESPPTVQNQNTSKTTTSPSQYQRHHRERVTLSSLLTPLITSFQRIFPTIHTLSHRLPLSLLPFAFMMFILVQGLASKGWVEIFGGWWDDWVRRTGVVGAVFGMVGISGVLCNVCGTNIGTTILLARTLQAWLSSTSDTPSKLLQYASIYALALGSNYGAFTFTFGASLAGLLWRDILRQKGIVVRRLEFAKINVALWIVACLAGGAALVGQAIIKHGW